MRQIIYVSSSKPRGTRIDVGPILQQSRHNNAIDGVTGLLYTDGVRFLQAIEGPEDSIAATFARIEADTRHGAIVVLADRSVEERDFGQWSMADATNGESAAIFDERITRALRNAPADVAGIFLGLIAARKAR